MSKQFNADSFREYLQDHVNLSKIDTKESYLRAVTLEAIDYCTNILGMYPNKAYIVADGYYQSELKRLGV